MNQNRFQKGKFQTTKRKEEKVQRKNKLTSQQQ